MYERVNIIHKGILVRSHGKHETRNKACYERVTGTMGGNHCSECCVGSFWCCQNFCLANKFAANVMLCFFVADYYSCRFRPLLSDFLS